MLDIILFIPRLLWDIIIFLWKGVCFLWELISNFFVEMLPIEGTPHAEYYILFLVVWFGLAILLRKNMGGFFPALFKILGCLLGGILLYALSPIGLVITIIYSVLVGGGVVKDRPWMAISFALAWIVLIAIRIVG